MRFDAKISGFLREHPPDVGTEICAADIQLKYVSVSLQRSEDLLKRRCEITLEFIVPSQLEDSPSYATGSK